jgi:hypothetical protein
MELLKVFKEGETQGTEYDFGCTSNGTWGRLHCGITSKPVERKKKTPEEQKRDADMAQRLKEDPWAAYATDPQGNVTKYNMDVEGSATMGTREGVYSLRDGYRSGPVLNLPNPVAPSAEVQVCIKKEGVEDSGTTYEGHAHDLTTSYNPTDGKFCAGLTTDQDIGVGTSTQLK